MKRCEATTHIRAFRRNRGYSLRDLADILGMDHIEYGKLERGITALKPWNRMILLEHGMSRDLVEHLVTRGDCTHESTREQRGLLYDSNDVLLQCVDCLKFVGVKQVEMEE